MKLNFDCYQALRARDPRFDGQFFVAVKTTGIYCRPICATRPPREQSCLFVETAAAAEQAGFRPCLRCRPELAPGVPAVSLEEALFAEIRARAVEGDSVEQVARRAGFSARQLRRLLAAAFGVTPVEIMQTERLLFAKRLLQETALGASEVALSSGFGSVRRFNALFRSRYGRPPTALRRPGADRGDLLRLRLSYRPPLAWRELLEYLARRAVPGVEAVSIEEGTYARTVGRGWLLVRRPPGREWLEVTLPAVQAGEAWAVLRRLRALFDLDANPVAVEAVFGADPLLGPGVRRHPGLRVPGVWTAFELAVRAVLGQQVSVAGATTLAGRLAAKYGEPVTTPIPSLQRLAPTAEAVAAASVEEIAAIGLPRARAAALRALAEVSVRDELDFALGTSVEQAVASLRRVAGIGEWTAQYVAMRALRFPDAFPAGDLGLRKALAGPGEPLPSEKQVRARAEAWRPWRAYAALHLWQTLHDNHTPSL